MNARLFLLAGVAVSLSLGGCVDRAAQAQAKATAKIVTNPVQTVAAQPAEVTTLVRNQEVNGQVTTSSDTQVGAKTAGRIVAMYVNDGDHVKVGQILAVQDPIPLQASLNQAQASLATSEAGLLSAESSLTQALRNATINPLRSTAAVVSAEAAVRASKANYDKTVSGARPQERAQAQATLNSAKANLDVQKKQLDRIKVLVEQGALAGSQLDTQLAAYESALATYQNADEAMSMIKQGNRQEDIDSAKEQVAQANEALKTARASKDLDTLYKDQVAAARAQVDSAKAAIQNSRAEVVIAKQGLADSVIRAPFDGQVSGKPVELGSIAVPGTPILRIVGRQGIYFEGNVPSDVITQVSVGMPVKVSVDAVAAKQFSAHIAAVSPLASSVGRLFTIRVQFDGASGEVRPGMFATGEVQVQTVPNATVVPMSAVLTHGDQKYVFLAKDKTAKKTIVTLGLQEGTLVQVHGIAAGDPVIVEGQDRISDGAPITVDKPVTLTSASGTNTNSAGG